MHGISILKKSKNDFKDSKKLFSAKMKFNGIVMFAIVQNTLNAPASIGVKNHVPIPQHKILTNMGKLTNNLIIGTIIFFNESRIFIHLSPTEGFLSSFDFFQITLSPFLIFHMKRESKRGKGSQGNKNHQVNPLKIAI